MPPRQVPVAHDEAAQTVLHGRGQGVKPVGSGQQQGQHRRGMGGLPLRQASPQAQRVFAVKARAPHQGQQLGMGVIAAVEQGRGMRPALARQLMQGRTGLKGRKGGKGG
jgi:hypothetical protein